MAEGQSQTAKRQELLFTVPLSDAMRAPQMARGDRAVTVVRDFLVRHAKADEKSIRIGASINEEIWGHGGKSIPKKITIHAKADAESGLFFAELAGTPFPSKEKEKEKEKPKDEAPEKKGAAAKKEETKEKA